MPGSRHGYPYLARSRMARLLVPRIGEISSNTLANLIKQPHNLVPMLIQGRATRSDGERRTGQEPLLNGTMITDGNTEIAAVQRANSGLTCLDSW